ncbi:glycine receptor subunit alphaZ1-like, partial [Penaeus indicus]|uniref:glycine receptor subunit alphaZ1-like n=1 Tax=Penaeus indicus TaxID=29960 RepID=UPI00300D37DB
WISFWIRPEIAPARVTLGVTSLLTLSTQHAKSQAALPPVSYIKAIDVFMSSCTVFVFMALMEYAVVNVILGDGPGDDKKPGAQGQNPDPKAAKVTYTSIKTSAQERRARAIMVDRGSRYLFPLSFAILNCIYWITFWSYL